MKPISSNVQESKNECIMKNDALWNVQEFIFRYHVKDFYAISLKTEPQYHANGVWTLRKNEYSFDTLQIFTSCRDSLIFGPKFEAHWKKNETKSQN